jgi:uncharacterized protein (TIGR02231 family)
MSYLKLAIFAVLVCLPLHATAAEINRLSLPTRITSVTLYPDRAMTTRAATLELKPGSYILEVPALPVLLQDDSLRVSGRGSAVATITGMETKRTFLDQTPEKRAGELEAEMKKLQRAMGSLDARVEGLNAQKGFIDSIRMAWGERISKELAVGKPTATELNEALTFIGSGITNGEEKRLDLEAEKAKLKEKLDALAAQLEAVRGSTGKEAKVVDVAVEVTKGGKFILELSGVVSHAGWEPAYDARLGDDGNSVELLFKGQVRQQTGEDWSNVDLFLSTARPALGSFPPTLYPWRLSFHRPAPVYPAAAAPASVYRMKALEMKPETADQAAEPEEQALYLTAGVAQEQTSVVFHLRRTVDIPADGSGHDTTVALETLPVQVDYLAVPKLAPHAYLRAAIVNNASYPLLAGKVNIFTGGNFIGSGRLKKVAAGEKFELFFGGDDQIAIKREELKRHKEAGLFGRNRQTYSYRIEVHNYRKEKRTVTITDQLPVAVDEEIKVVLAETSIKPDEIKADGNLVWKLPIDAGEKREITFTIEVEYPKDREVNGL